MEGNCVNRCDLKIQKRKLLAILHSLLANEKIMGGYTGSLCELLFDELLVWLIQPKKFFNIFNIL